MMTALSSLKFAIFVVVVLALPAGLMAQDDPRMIALGKLAMILTPGAAGLILNLGVGDARRGSGWRRIMGAAGVTLAVAGCALAAAVATGAASFRLAGIPVWDLMALAGGAMLTSVLEELGWAGGGLALADRALGPRWGVTVLGVVWAAWHLIPVVLGVGLFPYLEEGPPAMIAAFVAACILYRHLLTDLRRRAGTWMAAAAGHAAPNIALAGLMAAGLDVATGPWWWFPAPGGLVFPLMTIVAIFALRARGSS